MSTRSRHALVVLLALAVCSGCRVRTTRTSSSVATAFPLHAPALSVPSAVEPEDAPPPAPETFGPQAAQEPAKKEPSPYTSASEEDWHFVIAPYGWLISLDGNATVDGTTSIIDEDFDDLFKNINFVAEGRFEAWRGSWGAIADVTYVELETDESMGPVDIESNTDVLLLVAGGMKRVVDQEVNEDGAGGVKVDAILGLTYTSLDVTLDVDPGPKVKQDEDWVDPILGLRSRFNITEKWGAHLELLIGGFDLFDGSDFVSMATALIGRETVRGQILYFGWRNLDIEYENGDFGMDVTFNGPIVGYEFHF